MVEIGFRIAFAMLDQDGNERIEKEEFKVLETVFSSAARERKTQQLTDEEDTETLAAGMSIYFDFKDRIYHVGRVYFPRPNGLSWKL